MRLYWQIFRNEYRNPNFYLYLFCWLPAIIIILSGTSPWTALIVAGQLPFVFPVAVMIENPQLRREPEAVDSCPDEEDQDEEEHENPK